MNNLHTVINQGRDYPANHPTAGQRTDYQQDNQSRRYTGDIVYHRQLDCFPTDFAVSYCYQAADCRGGKQYDLASSAQGIATESADGNKQKGYQYEYGYQGK